MINRHDVSMQVVGQPARDLCRHFVQRYVIKGSRNARPYSWHYVDGIICCELKYVMHILYLDLCLELY